MEFENTYLVERYLDNGEIEKREFNSMQSVSRYKTQTPKHQKIDVWMLSFSKRLSRIGRADRKKHNIKRNSGQEKGE